MLGNQENNWTDTSSKNEWSCTSCHLILEVNLGLCQFHLGRGGSVLSENRRSHRSPFPCSKKYRSLGSGHNACLGCFRFNIRRFCDPIPECSLMTELHSPFRGSGSDGFLIGICCRFAVIIQDCIFFLLNNPACIHSNFTSQAQVFLAHVHRKLGQHLKTGSCVQETAWLHSVQRLAKYSIKPCLCLWFLSLADNKEDGWLL